MTIDKLKDMGLQVELVAVNKRYQHPGKPYLACEIDFELVITGDVEIGDTTVSFISSHVNADAKSVTGFARKKWGEVGTDEVPIEYAAQFMHGLGITTRPWCLVAALRSFDDVDLFWVQYDVETIAAMQEKCIEFWEQHVLKDIPPDPLNFADVKLLYAKADPLASMKACEDEALVQRVYDLKKVTGAIKELEERAEVLKFEITREIGEATGLAFGGKPLCTWGNEKMTRFQQKEFAEAYPELAEEYTLRGTHRVLRVKVK
jgi:predicted phage-related endonuclease